MGRQHTGAAAPDPDNRRALASRSTHMTFFYVLCGPTICYGPACRNRLDSHQRCRGYAATAAAGNAAYQQQGKEQMKKAIPTLIAASMFAFAASASAADSKVDPKKPEKPAVEDKAGAGKSKEAKVKDGAAPKNATVAADAKRAGPYSCDIHIDNRTQWRIHRVYIDGRNWGSVGQYGDSMAKDVAAGATRVYAEADFTDGSTKHWGPRVFQCDSWGTYKWTLNN
jgi:hypothetical protein